MMREERVKVTCYDVRNLRRNGGYALKMIEREKEICVKFGGRTWIPGDMKRLAIIFGSKETRENAKIANHKLTVP